MAGDVKDLEAKTDQLKQDLDATTEELKKVEKETANDDDDKPKGIPGLTI